MIFGPIDQVGWASASSTLDRGQLVPGPPPERAPGRGEHQPAPRRPGVAGPQALVERAVLGVHRDDLGARRCAVARWTTGAPAMSDSLLARARRRPASSAARVTGSPAKPTTPLTDHLGQAWRSRPGPRSRPPPRSPAAAAAASSGASAGSPMATTSGRSRRAWATEHVDRARWPRAPPRRTGRGTPSITSTAWVPIDPVDPTRLTVTARRAARGQQAPRTVGEACSLVEVAMSSSLPEIQPIFRARTR